jgi:AraC family transcriptional regulator of adaptative response/methylated-DNA-[protein]-cysteine methyltransferase
MKMHVSAKDYERIEKAILFLEKNIHRQPGLKELSRIVNLSEYYFQRLFKRWAGISPKRFLQVLTIEHAKRVMKNSDSLLGVSYETGLSSAGRLHDLFVSVEAMTPDEFRRHGKQLRIRYGFNPSPFGECLVAVTSRGICHLAFVPQSGRAEIVSELRRQWKNAEIIEDASVAGTYVNTIFSSSASNTALPLFIKGTNFQIKVWQALLKIPVGMAVSYEDIARRINRPKSVRAVANAVAHNPIAFLIPCHRIIRKTGAVGGYRWGSARKKAMLIWEAGRKEEVKTEPYRERS